MKLSLFKKVIREVIREEIEYSLAGLRKELKEALVSKINNEMLNETPSVAQSTEVVQKPVTESKQRVPMTKDSILNNLLKETADSGEWQNIIKETARLNKIDETGKSLSPDRVLASRESLYLQTYGDGSKARNHAVFDINVAPEIRKAGKNPRGRIKLKDGEYDTKRKTPGVYIDVDNGKVIEISPELETIELPEFSALLR